MYKDNIDASLIGGLAWYVTSSRLCLFLTPRSGVTGELRGLKTLHKKYGRLRWAKIIRPSVKVARHGFLVTEDLVAAINRLPPQNFLSQDPNWAIDFAPNGTVLGVGDVMTRKRYANLLEVIAEQGPDSFYKGGIARTIIAALKAAGGIMTLDDLANYAVVSRKHSSITYRNYKVTSCSTPSGGTIAMNILKTVEGYKDFGWKGSLKQSTHRFDEAMRFGYGLVSLSPSSAVQTYLHHSTAYQAR